MHANFKDTVWGNKDNAVYGILLYYNNMLSIIIQDNYLASKVGYSVFKRVSFVKCFINSNFIVDKRKVLEVWVGFYLDFGNKTY